MVLKERQTRDAKALRWVNSDTRLLCRGASASARCPERLSDWKTEGTPHHWRPFRFQRICARTPRDPLIVEVAVRVGLVARALST